MYEVGTNFLEDLTKYGRQFDTEVLIDGKQEPITVYDINSFKHSFNAELFQSVMRVLEIDSNIKIDKCSKITGKLGIKFDEDVYDYINYEDYSVIDEPEYNEDTKSYNILAYDRMVESMIEYNLNVEFPITVRNYLIKLCERLSWSTSGIPVSFINSSKILYEDVFTGIGYTFRNVLDEIAKVTCSFPCFVDGVFTLKYITETEKTIDDTYLNEDNLSFIKEFSCNSVVFARSEDSDTFYKQDAEDIAQNGLHEYKLSDLRILDTDNRSEYITEIYRYMRGLKFWIFDIATKGVLIFDIADRFTINSNGNIYSIVPLNSDIMAEQGIAENMYADEPAESETDYKCSTSDEKKDNLTKLQIDKVNQKIKAVVKQIGDRSQKSTTLTQDLEQLQIAVSEVTDMTRDGTGNNTLHITDTVEGSGYILNFNIFGSTENMYFVTPEPNLVPSNNLKPNGGYVTVVCDTSGRPLQSQEAYMYKIKINEPLRNLGEVKDELKVSNSGEVSVVRRLGTTGGVNGDVYILDEETTEILTDITIIGPNGIEKSPKAILHTFEDDTYIYIKEFYNLDYEIKYITQSDYSEQFVTKVDFESLLTIKSQEILSKVSAEYVSSTELNSMEKSLESSIRQTSESIVSTVSATYATKKELGTTETNLRSTINQTSTSILGTVSATYSTKSELNTTKKEISASLELKVDTKKLISTINASADVINLKARKVINNFW